VQKITEYAKVVQLHPITFSLHSQDGNGSILTKNYEMKNQKNEMTRDELN
jgi:hypothetical protein